MAEKTKLTAEERLKKIEQKRAKLAEEAAKIRKEARKKEANVKMKLGGLVWKAGLQDQPDNVILGILVAGFEKLEAERDSFEDIGRKKFEHDAKAKAEMKTKSQEEESENSGHGSAGVKNHLATPAAVRFYLNVPIEEKDAAKALGARWDGEHKKWWCHPADKEKIHQVVAGGGVDVNKDVEEIFENIRDVVAVHQDDVAAMGKHVAQMKSELQTVGLSIRALEEASRKAEAAGQRITQQLTEAPRITRDRAKMWVGLAMLAALLFFAAGGYAGWRYAQDGVTKEIAQLPELAKWAASKEGKAVYQFATQGELQRLMRCQGDGWQVKNGVCYPFPNSETSKVHGWRMP